MWYLGGSQSYPGCPKIRQNLRYFQEFYLALLLVRSPVSQLKLTVSRNIWIPPFLRNIYNTNSRNLSSFLFFFSLLRSSFRRRTGFLRARSDIPSSLWGWLVPFQIRNRSSHQQDPPSVLVRTQSPLDHMFRWILLPVPVTPGCNRSSHPIALEDSASVTPAPSSGPSVMDDSYSTPVLQKKILYPIFYY